MTDIFAAVREWQSARSACMAPAITQDELARLAKAETALASADVDAALTRANAATAAAYEVAAQVINDRGAVEQENFGLDRATQNFFRARDLVRALATPDQTAALDKLIAEAVKPYAEALRVLISHTHECERELTEALYHADFCGESRPLTDARATLAASKKGGA